MYRSLRCCVFVLNGQFSASIPTLADTSDEDPIQHAHNIVCKLLSAPIHSSNPNTFGIKLGFQVEFGV